MKQSSTISFNKSPREAFKNLFTKSFDPRIIRLFLIDNIQLQLLSFLSLYKLHFHITRSYCSTTHLDDIEKLRKPVTQVTKSSNLRIIPQSQSTIFNFDFANFVNFQRKVSTRISSRKINFHDIWKPVTIFTKSFNLRINLNRRYLIPQKR